ncbi:MAG TPA: serine hydrolase domain-containing protein [Candidatus Polarisedimenticolia bacterium]|nr:serine hydrolase domain-containing protein [Candidatus Polarisedimenticolia bacterium]
MSEALDRFLGERVERGEIPGAAYAVAGDAGILDEGSAGLAVAVPERVAASPDTIYDLASLTKPLATSFLYLLLREELSLPPGMPVRRLIPELDRMDKRGILLEHLLTHTSGLPDWIPFYLRGSTLDEYLSQLTDRPLEAPPGGRVIYSCAGYITLAAVLQRAATEGLQLLADRFIIRPLGLRDTGFLPPGEKLGRVAATEDSCEYERTMAGKPAEGYGGFRKGVIRGEVHDQNAWVLGGVSGNAGLFSTARETALLALEYLGAGRGLLDGQALDLARTDRTPGREEARSFAFRLNLRGETAGGPDLSPRAFGHNGFTGTSVWIDPVPRRVHVLLTNRVHPAVSDKVDMLALRRRFHSIASAL